MEFGLENCAEITIEKNKITRKQNILLDEKIIIKSISENDIYKYLEISLEIATEKPLRYL